MADFRYAAFFSMRSNADYFQIAIAHAMFKWAKQPGRKFVSVNPFADLPAPGGAKV